MSRSGVAATRWNSMQLRCGFAQRCTADLKNSRHFATSLRLIEPGAELYLLQACAACARALPEYGDWFDHFP
jgi:hypothetical protein